MARISSISLCPKCRAPVQPRHLYDTNNTIYVCATCDNPDPMKSQQVANWMRGDLKTPQNPDQT